MELLEKYESIVEKIETEKQEEMFYSVSRDMFIHFCENHPDIAKKYLDKLDGMRYRNFVTNEEASKIVSCMKPAAVWSHDKLYQKLEELELEIEGEELFNFCSLWVVMNQVHSDHALSIAHAIGVKTIAECDCDTMVQVCYDLAIDLLTDEDEKYNIRDYFNL